MAQHGIFKGLCCGFFSLRPRRVCILPTNKNVDALPPSGRGTIFFFSYQLDAPALNCLVVACQSLCLVFAPIAFLAPRSAPLGSVHRRKLTRASPPAHPAGRRFDWVVWLRPDVLYADPLPPFHHLNASRPACPSPCPWVTPRCLSR